MNYRHQTRHGAASRQRWSSRACEAHTRSVPIRAEASLAALEAELSEPTAEPAPLPEWAPDYTVILECARLADPRYIQVRINGRHFGTMSHTALAAFLRRQMKRKTRG